MLVAAAEFYHFLQNFFFLILVYGSVNLEHVAKRNQNTTVNIEVAISEIIIPIPCEQGFIEITPLQKRKMFLYYLQHFL
uniref:Uncharacterized protein n=1 Tax=Glossina brevipalpis TaxID=37001 RepID=A0A1A9X337_9MUSC